MLRSTCLCACLLGLAATPSAFGQAPAPAQTPPPAPPPWSVGGIDFSGLVDAYYTENFNHPASSTNGLYNFNVKANQFSLNMAKLSMAHTADPIGFQVDLGFGRAFDMIHAGEPKDAPAIIRNVEQAYVSWKPVKNHGFQLDFGQYVTAAGAEVIESHSNWNYSRSLLFAWAIPYYHFGLRATIPVGTHFVGGVHVANGWNVMEDNNSGKTVGLMGNFVSKKVSWNNTYHTGPENPGTNRGFRNLYDTTLLLTPADKFNAYFNFDYGRNASYTGKTKLTAEWYGIAGAAKIGLTAKSSITPRIEWYKDRDGFTTGTAQALKEFTFTYEYKWVQGLLSRVEYRRDWSDQKFFERGSTGASDHQDTLTLGVVAFFGPK